MWLLVGGACCYFIPSRKCTKLKLQLLLVNLLLEMFLLLIINLFPHFVLTGGGNVTTLREPQRLKKLNESICCEPKSWEEMKLGNVLFFFSFRNEIARKVISKALCSESQPPSYNLFVYTEGRRRLGGLTALLPHISPGSTFGFNYFVPLGNEWL